MNHKTLHAEKSEPRCKSLTRRLKFEQFEDRRMLTTMVDIVFLVDESGSELSTATHEWLRLLVEGDAAVDGLHDTLTDVHSLDVRYGLVGFGEKDSESPFLQRYAHSQLVNSDTQLALNQRLFSDLESDILPALEPGLSEIGGREDGWDAIEHAIAEYQIRDGAVPVFVLVQNEEGRVNNLNPTVEDGANLSLTRDGILAALRSKNVLLNSLVVGPNEGSDPAMATEPLFDLTAYGLSEDIRILGVDADANGDRAHDYHWFDTDTINSTTDTPTETTADTLQISYNGANTGASGMVASGRSILIGPDLSGGIVASGT